MQMAIDRARAVQFAVLLRCAKQFPSGAVGRLGRDGGPSQFYLHHLRQVQTPQAMVAPFWRQCGRS